MNFDVLTDEEDRLLSNGRQFSRNRISKTLIKFNCYFWRLAQISVVSKIASFFNFSLSKAILNVSHTHLFIRKRVALSLDFEQSKLRFWQLIAFISGKIQYWSLNWAMWILHDFRFNVEMEHKSNLYYDRWAWYGFDTTEEISFHQKQS